LEIIKAPFKGETSYCGGGAVAWSVEKGGILVRPLFTKLAYITHFSFFFKNNFLRNHPAEDFFFVVFFVSCGLNFDPFRAHFVFFCLGRYLDSVIRRFANV